MKKNQLIKIMLAVFFCTILITKNVQAVDNYLYLRLEKGERVSNAEDFGGTYAVFENNGIKDLSIGTKFCTGNHGYNKLQPYIFKTFFSGWQAGAKYSEDSLGNQTLGPAIRFKGNVWKLFVIFDYVRDFGINQQTPAKNDMWFFFSTTNPTFNLGAEVWYHNYLGGSKNLYLRPVRLSYKYESVNFFLMPNFFFLDSKLANRSLMTGVEIKF
ncbi:MAG TPA: hypothetical protein P5232_02290 [Candidatus Moranbacteria bacterium]|nr:hypothetical protein [Candidatus Moranbacteria bacterium]